MYIQTFPEPGGKWQISTGGGSQPRWRRDGKELFYIAGEGLMAVEVKTDSSTFEAGIPKALFEARFPSGGRRNHYLVTADGQRFLINTPVEQTTSPIHVVLNWFEDLKRLAPTGR
ncbi:hypothetical protein MYX78_02410 [Acidobacteria bacterium AH-259-G07]|nr:hypothetical protein [Acidobacteria bacterium AH-259-G07]